MQRMSFENREEWLSARKNWIGCSEAAACAGLSPFLSNTELWMLKTGQAEERDLSENEAVQTGVRIEPIMRELYAAEHIGSTVDYYATDVLWQKERPWIRGTLDGEITDENMRKGVLEIKCVSVASRMAWEKWNGKIPQHYYCQILCQLYCTGFEFVDLYARLKKRDGDLEIRCYHFERADCEADIEWMIEQVDKFWLAVQRRQMPSKILPEV